MPKKGKKGDNTFRFQSFSEQINVSIDVHRNARLTSKEIPENDKDTFFRESLEKWAELNCSIDYTKLYRKLKPLSRSFNQLVYHKDQVVEILKEYLSKDESLAHEACVELLAHMSKDLLDEFYPFFDQFFPLLVKFLGNNQNTKLIESTFICFAYIFKFLWKWMLKDLKNFFKTFSLLVSASQKHHIQVFASEAFAFLIRKSKDKPKVIKFLLEQIDCTLNEGVGHLLFQSVKGIKSQLNLAGEEVLMVILDTLYLVNNEKEEVMKALRVLWISILRHCSKENANILSKILYNSIENYFKSNKDDLETMQCFLLLLTEIVDFKNGDYIDTQHCLQVITYHLKKLNDDDIQELIQSLSAKLIKTINGNLTDDDIVNFINDYANLFSKDTRKPLQLYRQLLNWYKIDLIKPSMLSFISKHFKNVDKGGDFLEFLVEFVYNVDPRGKLCRPIEQQTINESILDFERRKREKHFHSRVIEGLNIELWSDNPGFFWCSSVVLMHTRFEPTKKDLCDISELAKEILDKLDESLSTHHLLALCYLVACFQLMKAKSEAVCEDLPLKKMTELVRLHPSSEHCLQAFDVYVSTSSECSSEESSTIMNILKENLNSPFKLNRILTLRIFDSLQAKSTIESDVFKNCLVAEEIEVTLNTYRDRMMHLQKLTFRQDTTLPPDQIMECVLRYLIGNFYLNFSLVWEPTTKVILSYMGEEHDKTNYLWTVWMEILNNITGFCENPKPPFTKDDEERNLSETYLTFYNVFRIEKTEYRPDYQNFRYLMWKAMSDFASVVERRSRFVMPLFFQFVE
ncbi:small subunit processome component 20 homolog [Clytia hemisphaerica]|uniref:Uncharacterized protein n=1 Tax=Clytia hemisphaerica TaxID=252671 RepID=A0A7M5XJL8_9CNID